jgi:hypothetical protein
VSLGIQALKLMSRLLTVRRVRLSEMDFKDRLVRLECEEEKPSFIAQIVLKCRQRISR